MTIDYYLQGKLDVLVKFGILTSEEKSFINNWQHDSDKLHDAKEELEKIHSQLEDIKTLSKQT